MLININSWQPNHDWEQTVQVIWLKAPITNSAPCYIWNYPNNIYGDSINLNCIRFDFKNGLKQWFMTLQSSKFGTPHSKKENSYFYLEVPIEVRDLIKCGFFSSWENIHPGSEILLLPAFVSCCQEVQWVAIFSTIRLCIYTAEK